MFYEGVLFSSFTILSISTFAASIMIAVEAIHPLSIPTFAASIMIAVEAIHLLLCCFDCNGGRERKRYRQYDVFLSFCGRDVRKGFVDHLYHALAGAGFRVFLDTCDLRRGEDIFENLQHGIEVSNILIPIFSTNYAKSAWCLREVSLIARQVEKGSAIAVPLFYNVRPFQVRHADQSHGGPYAEALKEHKSRGKYNAQEIDEWKAALFTLSNLSGWSLQEDTNG
jgi:hypothetical protein